eukprot:gene25156-31579_t
MDFWTPTQIYDLYASPTPDAPPVYRWNTIAELETSSDEEDSVGEKRKLANQHDISLSTLDRIEATLVDVTQFLPLLKTPFRLSAMGRMVMHTNERNFITKIVFETPFEENNCISNVHCEYPQQ